MPTVRSGAPQASPIAPIESDDVLLAITAPGDSARRSASSDLALEQQILRHRLDHEIAALDGLVQRLATVRRSAAALVRPSVAQTESQHRRERLGGAQPA